MHAFEQRKVLPKRQSFVNQTRSNLVPADTVQESAHSIRNLASAVGNQAMLRLMGATPGTSQAKTPAQSQPRLTVSQSEDVNEQEADRIAEQIIDTSGTRPNQLQPYSSSAGPVKLAVPPIVDDVLTSHGQPLDPEVRAFMEPRFGHDFSRVRVHAGARAAQSVEAVGAQAYTVGSDIVLGSEYASTSRDGTKLMAHELAHVVQQDGNRTSSGTLQRKVDTTKDGVQVVRFTIGAELDSLFAFNAWERTKAGPLSDRDLSLLHSLALQTGQTVDDNERMFLAALLDAGNARKFHDEYFDPFVWPGKSVEFAASSITASNRDRVHEVGRADNLNAPDTSDEPNTEAGHAAALDREIVALAGRFSFTAQQAIAIADTISVSHIKLYYAMLNGASDSTPGDRAFAGAAYVMALKANLPVADDILRGRLKVDEVPSGSIHGRVAFNAEYVAEGGDGLKGDTIYLPTQFDVSKLDQQGTLVHELTHAATDKAATGRIEVPKLQSEEDAYRREARFYLDSIAPLTGDSREKAVSLVRDAATKPVILCMALEALLVPIERYDNSVRIIKDVNDVGLQLSRSDLNVALSESQKDLEKRILDAIRELYQLPKNAKTLRAGFAGESVLDTPSQ